MRDVVNTLVLVAVLVDQATITVVTKTQVIDRVGNVIDAGAAECSGFAAIALDQMKPGLLVILIITVGFNPRCLPICHNPIGKGVDFRGFKYAIIS